MLAPVQKCFLLPSPYRRELNIKCKNCFLASLSLIENVLDIKINKEAVLDVIPALLNIRLLYWRVGSCTVAHCYLPVLLTSEACCSPSRDQVYVEGHSTFK